MRITRLAVTTREWSSRKFRISTGVPSASLKWVTSDCQRSFGSAASKRTHELLGRLCGWGLTSPRRLSTRQIVETEGTGVMPFVLRWKWIVWAPASNPAEMSSPLIRTMASSTSAGVRPGTVDGARERGVSAS